MKFIEKLDKRIFRFSLDIIFFIAGVLHIYVYSLSNEREIQTFNVHDLFNSSPLFDFSISEDCGNRTKVIFHKWNGFKAKKMQINQTDIVKINRNYFCYKHISYKDLLYNGQIIKNGAECPKEYNKNCGRIDTLNQELCIKENEKCPLYDIGIGLPPNSGDYIYDNDSNIYYNNDNYNAANKTIIGRLILNDGQPCYNSTEKLWRSFEYSEYDDTHLNCTIQVFDKNNDDRFIEKGNITYKKLYEDNLNEYIAKQLIKKMKGNESVYLYKREFYGLDKKCSKKYYLIDILDSYKSIQNSVVLCELIQGIFIFSLLFAFIFPEILICLPNEEKVIGVSFYHYIPSFVLCGVSFAFYSIALFRIIQNDYSDFNCSDQITNEIIRKGQEVDKVKTEIKCNCIDSFSDFAVILTILFIFLFCTIWEIHDRKKSNETPGKNLDKENTPCENNEKNTPCETNDFNGYETPWYDTPGENNETNEKDDNGVKIPLNTFYKEKSPIN